MGRPKSPFNVRAYPQDNMVKTKKANQLNCGIQLQAKQRLKAYYGNINERQFKYL